jgi:hypothetical protein
MTDVYCGMDFTIIEVVSTPKKALEPQQPQQSQQPETSSYSIGEEADNALEGRA